MGKIELEITEPKFARKYTIYYKLSILIGMDSLCYSIADKHQNLLVVRKYPFPASMSLQDWKGQVQEIILSDALLRRPFASITVGWVHSPSTLVPNRLYNDNERRVYLENLTSVGEKDEVLIDELPLSDAMVVFSVQRPLIELVRQYFPSGRYCHLMTSLATAYGKLVKDKLGHSLFVNVRQGALQLFLFDDQDLHFYNSFPFLSSRDFIYYLLLAFDQFDLKPESVPVVYSGQLMEDSEIYRLMTRYIRHLRPVDDEAIYHYGAMAGQGLEKHWLYDLFSLRYCS